MEIKKPKSIVGRLIRGIVILVGGTFFAILLFMTLPVLQAIAGTPKADLTVLEVDVADVPPPPAPLEEEKEEEKQVEEEKPPELTEEAPPLDLSQLEIALNPGVGGAGGAADFAVKLNVLGGEKGGSSDSDALFSLSDLDQKPRAVFQPSPQMTTDLKRRTPANVAILFVVDQDGRVESPIVQKSSDAAFERAALAAVKQWKFEPGKRNGKAVRFRMRVPITFPKE